MADDDIGRLVSDTDRPADNPPSADHLDGRCPTPTVVEPLPIDELLACLDEPAPQVADDDDDEDAATDVDEAVDVPEQVDDDVDLLALVAATAEQLRVAAAAAAAEEAAIAAAEEAAAPEPVTTSRAAAVPTVAGDPFAATALGSQTATGLLLQYPSRDFPPPPVVRLAVPTGWLGTALPDCEMAARGPEQVDGMYPTVIMRVRRIAAAAAHDGSLTTWMSLPPDDEADVIGDELRSDATAPARRMLVRRTATDGRVALSCHLFVHVPATEHVSSVVAITATWPEAADAELRQPLTDVVSSVRIFMPQRGR